jgi:hypothetical protein
MPQPDFAMMSAPGLPPEPVLVAIGDILVTQTTVYTPSGSRPVNEVSWNVTDMTMTTQGIPTWAVVCAIIGTILLCGLGLLFLLAKEVKTTGTMQIIVNSPGFIYSTSIPVFSPMQVADVNARVNYARTVAAVVPQAPYQGINDQPPGMGQIPGQGW